MIEIQPATPEYFIDLAVHLINLKGRPDDFGLVYSDNIVEIRASSDFNLVRVVALATAGLSRSARDDKPLLARREGEKIELNSEHAVYTSRMAWALSSLLEGPHLYEVTADGRDGSHLVVAGSIRDVEETLHKNNLGRDIARLISVRPVEVEETNGFKVLVSDAIKAAREIEAKIEAMQESTDSIYLFTFHDSRDDAKRTLKSLPMQAIDLTDAEASLRGDHPRATLILTNVEITPVLAFYEARRKSRYQLPEVINSLGVKLRDAAV